MAISCGEAQKRSSRASGHNLITVGSEMQSSRSTEDGVRSHTFPNRACSTRRTSLWTPVVSNGLPLTKLHHAAFDAHLIGIDPDYRIHVADRLLEIP
jgi:hypothetical protein